MMTHVERITLIVKLNLKLQITVQIIVPLKYLSNFWRTLEMTLINCEINLILTWSPNCIVSNVNANQATTFTIIDANLYVSSCNFINSR